MTFDPLKLSNDSRHAAIDRNSHFSSLNWIYRPGFSQDAKSWSRSSALLSQQRCSQLRSGVLRQHKDTHSTLSISVFGFPWLYSFYSASLQFLQLWSINLSKVSFALALGTFESWTSALVLFQSLIWLHLQPEQGCFTALLGRVCRWFDGAGKKVWKPWNRIESRFKELERLTKEYIDNMTICLFLMAVYSKCFFLETLECVVVFAANDCS